MVCVSAAFHRGWYGTAILCPSAPLDRASSSKPHADSLDFCPGRSPSPSSACGFLRVCPFVCVCMCVYVRAHTHWGFCQSVTCVKSTAGQLQPSHSAVEANNVHTHTHTHAENGTPSERVTARVDSSVGYVFLLREGGATRSAAPLNWIFTFGQESSLQISARLMPVCVSCSRLSATCKVFQF